MIVAMHGQATEENIQQVIERMVELGFNVHRTTGAVQTILAGVGTPEHFEVAEFKVLPGVYDAYRISSPYKLAGRLSTRGNDGQISERRSRRRERGCCDGRALLGGVA